MAGRTFAIGDIHGDLEHLARALAMLPALDRDDTLVFLGDYVDRGPSSAQVVELVRKGLAGTCPARIVALRGNHEDAWLKVIDEGWASFTLPPGNGCLACLRSYTGAPPPAPGEGPTDAEAEGMLKGSFFPADVVRWFRGLPFFWEDEHAIYVHAGLPEKDGKFLHPADAPDPIVLLWLRTEKFFREYRGKRVVVGHTATTYLPAELSHHTPEDPADLWAGEAVVAIDTGAGKGGFLTILELPGLRIYESRNAL